MKSKNLYNFSSVFIIFFIYFLITFRYAFTYDIDIPSDFTKQKYNVLLISICSLRPDHLGCYGYFRNTSPNIDKLAKEGILFENAFSHANYTLPSIISLHTSLYPNSHGVFYVGKDKLSTEIKTFAEILKDSGYKTVSFLPAKHVHTDPGIGLGRGFEYLEDICWPTTRFYIGEKKVKLFNWSLIRQTSNKKFFVSYHNLNTHLPYLPSLKYKKIFVKDYNGNIISSIKYFSDMQFKIIESDLKNHKSPIYEIFKEDINSHPEIFRGKFNQKKMIKLLKLLNVSSLEKRINFWHKHDPELIFISKINKDDPLDIKHLEDLYDACIFQFDQEFIGPLISKLKNLNLYDNAIIIITADHGEEFYEHGNLGHREFKLYDEVLHIPLIIKLPKDILYMRNRIENLVQGIDIMPSILDVLNIPIPRWAQGISLRGLWENRKDAVSNKYTYAIAAPVNMGSIRNEEYKLIYHFTDNQHNELYDLKEDRRETNNIYKEKSGIANKLEKNFYQLMENSTLYTKKRDFSPEINETIQEKIKKTGYW